MVRVPVGIVLGWLLAAAPVPPDGGKMPPAACVEAQPFTLEKAEKEHIEEVASGTQGYEINLGGTLDGFNTVAYLDTYSACKRVESKFEPNRYLVVENIGPVDVVNPRIVVAGRRDWFSVDSILASILKPEMTDAEKAMAIWCFTAGHQVQCHENNRRVGPPHPEPGSHPSQNTFRERANPVKAANCYYCSGCSLSAANFVILCRRAGLTARAVWMCPLDTYATHCVGEAWYDGGWHLFDPECRTFYLEGDNATIASYETLHKDPQLAARAHLGGLASKGMKSYESEFEQFYPPRVMPVENWISTMGMTLRPGEKFIWRWDHQDKFRYGNNPRNHDYLPYQLANGKIVYRPPLAGDTFRRGIVSAQNVKSTGADNGAGTLQPEIAQAPGTVVYKVESPYPIVGGIVGGTFYRKTTDDACRVYVSLGDADWIEVWSARQTGRSESYVSVDNVLDAKTKPAIYGYYVKFEIQAKSSPADAAIKEIYLETDVQMAATSLASLSVGANRVVYRDQSGPDRRVRITHGWRESSATRPPLAPARPVAPTDSGRIELAALETLAWEAAKDPEGQPIAGYHVQVSPRADMLHPVSPNFDRITGSAEPRWNVPEGWLVKGRTYYWRVRAVDAWGAWSDWSGVWKFEIAE